MADPAAPGVGMAPPVSVPEGERLYNEKVLQFGREEADGWKAASIGQGMAAGRTQKEIDDYFGDGAPEHPPTEQLGQTNILRFGPNTDPTTGIQRPDANASPLNDLIYGFNGSWLGEALNKFGVVGKANETGVFTRPAEDLPEGQGYLGNLAFQTSRTLGNLLPMLGGATAGFVTGGPVGAAAGAGALPTAAREVIVDSYGLPNGPKTPGEWLKVAGDGAWKTAQSGAVTGLAAIPAVKASGLAARLGGGTVIQSLAAGGGFTAASNALNIAMTGKVPSLPDFAAQATLMIAPGFALHYIGSRTGGQATPEEAPAAGPADQTVEKEGGVADWRTSRTRAQRSGYASDTVGGTDVSTVTEAQRRIQHNLQDIYAKTGTHPDDVATRSENDSSYGHEATAQDQWGDPVTPQANEAAPPSPEPFKPRPLTSVAEHRLQSQDIHDGNSAQPELAQIDNLIPALEGGVDRFGHARLGPVTGANRGVRAVGKYQIEPYTARAWGLTGTDAEISKQLEDPAVQERVAQRGMTIVKKQYPNDTLAQLVAWNAGARRANEFIKEGPGTRLEAIPDRTVRGGVRYEAVPAARNEANLPLETQKYLANGRRLAKGGSMGQASDQNFPQSPPTEPDLGPEERAEADELEKTNNEAMNSLLSIGKGSDEAMTDAWGNASPEMQGRISDAVRDEVLPSGRAPEDPDAIEAAKQDARVATERYLQFPELLPPEPPKAATGGSGGAARTAENATTDDLEESMMASVGKKGKADLVINPGQDVNAAITNWISVLWPAHLLDNDQIAAGSLNRLRQMGNEDWFRRVYGANQIYQGFEQDGRIDPFTSEIDKKNSTTKQMIGDEIAAKGGTLRGFVARMLALRTADRAQQGIDTGFPLDTAKALVADPANAAMYDKAIAMYQHFRDGLWEFAHKGGYISQAQIDGMHANDPVWVSMRRLVGDDATFDAKLSNGTLTRMGKVLHTMEGGDGKIIDPLVAGDDNGRMIVRNTLINIARAKIVDTFKANPEMAAKYGFNVKKGDLAPDDEIDSALRKYGFSDDELEKARETFGPLISERLDKDLKPTEFSYNVNGQRQVASVNDPLLAKLLKSSMNERDSIDFLQSLAAIDRLGVVLEPAFQAAFGAMHEMTAVIFDHNHPVPFYNMLSGMADVIGKSDVYRQVRAAGGLGKAITALDETWNANGDTYGQLGKENVWQRVINSTSDPQTFILSVLRGLQAPGNFMTAARNVGTFKLVTGRGVDPNKAAMAGRKESIDYQEQGASPVAQKVAAWANFFHARLLVLKQQLEGFEPQSKSFGAGKAAATIGAITFATVVSPFLLARIINHENDKHAIPGARYVDQPRYLRDTHLMLPVNGNLMSLKIPEGWGTIFGGATNRFFDAMIEHDPHAFDDWAADIFGNNVPNPIPSAGMAVAQLWAGKTPFGNPMVPDSLKRLTPDLQWTPNTTQTAKALSALIGSGMKAATGQPSIVSPIMLDQTVQAFLGPGGQDAMRLLNIPYEARHGGVDWTTAPMLRSFFVQNPGMNSAVMGDYYKDFDKFQANYNNLGYMKKRAAFGGTISMDNVNLPEASAVGVLQRTNAAIGQMRSIATGIEENDSMSPDEKRQHIATIAAAAITMAQTSENIMQAVKKAERGPPMTVDQFHQAQNTPINGAAGQ